MTSILIDLSSGLGSRQDGVVLFAATPDRAGGTGWLSGSEVETPLVAGIATLTNVAPGPGRLTIRAPKMGNTDKWAQSWRVTVPDQAEVNLEDLIEGQVDWPAPVVGQAQAAAAAAAASAALAAESATHVDDAIADAAGEVVDQVLAQVEGHVTAAGDHAANAAASAVVADTRADDALTSANAAAASAGTAANRVINLGGAVNMRIMTQAQWDVLTPAEKALANTLSVVV